MVQDNIAAQLDLLAKAMDSNSTLHEDIIAEAISLVMTAKSAYYALQAAQVSMDTMAAKLGRVLEHEDDEPLALSDAIDEAVSLINSVDWSQFAEDEDSESDDSEGDTKNGDAFASKLAEALSEIFATPSKP
jgi:hypothetical protein